LKHNYPHIDIDPYIKKTNKLFQDYIERELKNLEMIDKANENRGILPFLSQINDSKESIE
jgi:hypothetical protein